MACCRPPYWLTLLTILLSLTCSSVLSDEEDTLRLLKFKSSLSNTEELNWNVTSPPCDGIKENWKGVICDNDGIVFGLVLENMGLSGVIDMDTLSEITTIRTLSFVNNSFMGSMPNLEKMLPLRGIFLSYNKFSGEIGGDAFSGMSSLRKVELRNNAFTGKIPVSLTQLPFLMDLELQNNEFDGQIPDFEQKLLTVNFSNNRLDGFIPKGLSNQDPNSFAGNNLCGEPLSPCKISNSNGSGSSDTSSSRIFSMCTCFITILRLWYL
ncbi:hypothetical protein L1887_27731 [Cichorium endivia]|nr:hypothetical protein L1887_27731 [Cichorium endivia]